MEAKISGRSFKGRSVLNMSRNLKKLIHDHATPMMGALDSFIDRAEALESMVRRLEWCLYSQGVPRVSVCPVCLREKPEGHASACSLAVLLK